MSVSARNTAKLLTHGQYNNENIMKDIALGYEKWTTLVATAKLEIKSALDKALLQIESVLTTNSFAKMPTNNAHTTPAEFNPIGANKTATLSAIKNAMLVVMSCV